jgi:hypothetical protein
MSVLYLEELEMMSQTSRTFAFTAIAAALCSVPPAMAQVVTGPNAFFIARAPGPDCAHGILAMQAGALPPLPPPGMGPPPIQLRGQLRLGPHEPEAPITHEPYSAMGTTETVQTLADGNRIVHTNTSHYYRDSSGRTRTELSFAAIGPLTLDEARTVVMISDPVAKRRVVLHPESKRAEVLPFAPPGTAATSAAGGSSATVSASASAAPPPGQCAPAANLGQKTILGLAATGTRVEYTVPAGQIGNEQPITVTSEEWTSSELGVTLSSTQHDPLIGDTEFHLDQLARTEPDASEFAVPTDYTVVTVTPNKPVVIQR